MSTTDDTQNTENTKPLETSDTVETSSLILTSDSTEPAAAEEKTAVFLLQNASRECHGGPSGLRGAHPEDCQGQQGPLQQFQGLQRQVSRSLPQNEQAA